MGRLEIEPKAFFNIHQSLARAHIRSVLAGQSCGRADWNVYVRSRCRAGNANGVKNVHKISNQDAV